MFDNRKHLAAGALALVLGAGAAGMAIGGEPDATAKAGPVSCEIRSASMNGMISLEAVVRSDVAAFGSYRFRVAGAGGGGGTNIQQGGAFSAGPAGPVTVGRVMVGNTGGAYDATLEISADGEMATCSERVGGRI